MSNNVLITGGAGFIGSALALYLLEKGCHVRILDNLHPQIHGVSPEKTSPLYQNIKDKTEFIFGDVCDRQAWQQALKDMHYVVHLAAETGTGQSMYEIQRYTEVNVNGTAHLADLLTNSRHTVEKVVVASSRAVYGEGKYLDNEGAIFYPEGRQIADMEMGIFELRHPQNADMYLVPCATDESSKVQPNSIYGLTKYYQEHLLMIACRSLQIACTAFRYQNVYGPGQSLSNPYTGILSIFSNRIRQHKAVNIFEDGKETRDFVFIDDVVKATALSLEMRASDYKILNVGSGVATTVMDVAELLCMNYAIQIPLEVSGQFRKGDIRHNFADISLLKNTLNFAPETDFSTGIAHFSNWVQEQDVQPDRYEQSLKEMQAKGLMQ